MFETETIFVKFLNRFGPKSGAKNGPKSDSKNGPSTIRNQPGGAIFGSVFDSVFGTNFVRCCFPIFYRSCTKNDLQASLFLQWVDYLHHRCPQSKQITQIYMDETMVSYMHTPSAGNICRRRYFRHRRLLPVTKISQGHLRSTVTHCAFITSHAALEQVLPQVLIGSKSRFTLRVLNRLGKVPSTIHRIRGKSSWHNGSITLQVLESLSKACAQFPDLQPILLMDVCRSHFGAQVLEEARRLGFCLAFIPAGLTWRLQPLDFYVFAK